MSDEIHCYWVRFIRDGYHVREVVYAADASEAARLFARLHPNLTIVSVYLCCE